MSGVPRSPDSVRSFASDTPSPRSTHTPPALDHSRTPSPVRSEPNSPPVAPPAPAENASAAAAAAAPAAGSAGALSSAAAAFADGFYRPTDLSRQVEEAAAKMQSLAAASSASFARPRDSMQTSRPQGMPASGAGHSVVAAHLPSKTPFAFGDSTAAAGADGTGAAFDPSSFSFSTFGTATQVHSLASAKRPEAGSSNTIPSKSASSSGAAGRTGFRAPAASKSRRSGTGPAASAIAAAARRCPAADGFSGFSLPVPAGSTNNSGSSGASSAAALAVFDFGSPRKSVSAEDTAKRVALYRHALESIFAFLPLSDLSRVLATSREWAAAVGSMAPIAGRCVASVARRLDVAAVARSRLARNVRVIGASLPRLASADQASLDALSARCPNLRELHAYLDVAHVPAHQGSRGAVGVAPIQFPPRLRTLELHVGVLLVLDPTPAVLTQLHTRVIEAVAQLRDLQTLRLLSHSCRASLVPLQSLPNLTDLGLRIAVERWDGHSATDAPYIARLNELRQLGHLCRLTANLSDLRSFDLLLSEPTAALQWQDIGVLQVPWSNHVGRRLARLPRLNTLTLLALDEVEDADEDNLIDADDPAYAAADAERTSLVGLGNLASLTSLQLQLTLSSAQSNRFLSLLLRAAEEGALQRLLSLEVDATEMEICGDHLAAVLQGTPVLTSLSLVNLRTGSLRFLAHAPHTLRRLSLAVRSMMDAWSEPEVPFPASEAAHVRSLVERRQSDGQSQLEQLCLHGSLPLDAFARQHFRHLQGFEYLPPLHDGPRRA